MYDKKMVAAVCRAKCLRMSQSDEGFDMVRIMYYERYDQLGGLSRNVAELTLVSTF